MDETDGRKLLGHGERAFIVLKAMNRSGRRNRESMVERKVGNEQCLRFVWTMVLRKTVDQH